MQRRDPFDVLGVSPSASPAAVKVAWRRLARQHHPDVAGERPDAATRTMAEINAAYETLRDPVRRRTAEAQRERRARAAAGAAAHGAGPTHAAAGPARPAERDTSAAPADGSAARRTRPVTGRVDTSSAFHARNSVLTPREARRGAHPGGQAPIRGRVFDAEPPRASEPTGPLERLRARQAARRPLPPIGDARAVELTFGKFRGHTLGEVETFEPSYIDWIARTITRDPDLVAAARAIQVQLDRDGVDRTPRPRPAAPPAPESPPLSARPAGG